MHAIDHVLIYHSIAVACFARFYETRNALCWRNVKHVELLRCISQGSQICFSSVWNFNLETLLFRPIGTVRQAKGLVWIFNVLWLLCKTSTLRSKFRFLFFKILKTFKGNLLLKQMNPTNLVLSDSHFVLCSLSHTNQRWEASLYYLKVFIRAQFKLLLHYLKVLFVRIQIQLCCYL